MNWLDAERSREVDPVLECLTFLARESERPSSPVLIKAGLALSADGTLPFHQVEPALEQIGMRAEPVTRRLKGWPSAKCPAVLELEDERAAVLLDTRGNEGLVFAPGLAEPMWVKLAEIEPAYTGRAVVVEADPTLERENERPWDEAKRRHWFWSEVWKVRREFWPVLLAALIVNLLAFAMPLFTMNVYDRVIPNKAVATLWVLALGVLLALVFDFTLRVARARLIDEVGRKLDAKLSQKLFEKLMNLPMSDRQGSTGALARRVSDYEMVRDFFASTTVVLAVDLTFLFLFLAFITFVGGWIVLVPLAGIAFMLSAGLVLQRRMGKVALDAQADSSLQHSVLIESISGAETLKAARAEGQMLGRWRRYASMSAATSERMRKLSSVAVTLASISQQSISVGLLVGGFYRFQAGEMSMGAIIAIVMLSSRSMGPAAQIALLLTRGKQAWQALSSIEGLFGWDDERRLGSSVAPTVSNEAEIRLDDLSFAYPESSVPALDSLNLTIRPGERIAIIGRVASGKSTLGRIVCGLYQPTGGAMLIGGIDSRQYRPQDIRRAYRFVGQDAALFTGSIKDNLTIGDRGIDDTRLRKAMWMSGADEFLARDAGGFDRQVGDQGRRLSGGQRAFLSLARALVSPCQLLFLDEPTGAMDSQTERHFVERLQSAISPEQTLIISTHRPALFALCDRIIVLDQGKIVADGPKDSILKQASSMP